MLTALDIPNWQDPLLPGDGTILRSRPVSVNFDVLTAAQPAEPGADPPTVPIRFNLFDDVTITVIFHRAKPRYDIQIPENPFDLLGQEFEPVGYTWSGDIVGDHQGHVTLTTRQNICAANIHVAGAGYFKVRSLPGGQHAVREIDGSAAWECAVVLSDEAPGEEEGADGSGTCGRETGGCDDGNVIDIIVFYTTYAKDKAGGTAAIEDEIELGIPYINDAIYKPSGILTTLRVVYMGELVYDEACFIETSSLSARWDGSFDEVHDFRDALRADLVTVLFGSESGCNSSGWQMAIETPGFENRGFSRVVSAGIGVGKHVLAHEVGHNMGAHHARHEHCGGECICQQGLCDYSFGYNFPPGAVKYRTIMAGATENPNEPRVPRFSNPNVLYNGFPTGEAPPSCDSADNAQTINLTRETMANLRESCDTTDTTTRASYDFFEIVEGNADSREIAMSASGQDIAFTSDATTFGGQTGVSDIFYYNRESGLVLLMTNHAAGAGDDSFAPAVSGDGHFTAFASNADNLFIVGANPNNLTDIYVHEQFGIPRIKRISLDSNENLANDDCDAPSISYGGRYVAFESVATNLLGDGECPPPPEGPFIDCNGFGDIFVRDRDGNEDLSFDDPADSETARVSISTVGAEANGDSRAPSISRSSDPELPELDGRYVAFQSDASNLLDDGSDTNGHTDIFVRDTDPDFPDTSRVSVSSSGVQGNGPSSAPSISADGQRVAFQSDASSLLDDGSDTNGNTDIFVRDIGLQQTFRVSVSSSGDQADGHSFAPAISANGRFVAFHSDATNLLGAGVDKNLVTDVFVHDLSTGETVRVSVDSLGKEATGGPSSSPAISADGRFVGFESDATNLVSGDANGFRDVFFRDRGLCLGDLNGDGMVDAADLAILLGDWGPYSLCPPLKATDLNMDCKVGAEDLAILLGNWGICL